VKKDPPLILIAGGGHAMVVAEAAHLAGLRIVGLFDDRTDAAIEIGEVRIPRLGPLDDLAAAAENHCIVAIGDIAARRALIETLEAPLATVIHPSAFVSPTAEIGGGVFIGPGAIVHSRARIADHCIINSGAIVEHDCRVGENTHIAPGAVLGGEVEIGADTLVGLGSRVLPGVKIGTGCTVGAGAVVPKDIGDAITVRGVPAG